MTDFLTPALPPGSPAGVRAGASVTIGLLMAAYIAWEEDKMHRDPNRTMRVFLFNVLLFFLIAVLIDPTSS